MRILMISNFDISLCDSKMIENIDLSTFTKLNFPKYSNEDIELIIDEHLIDDIKYEEILFKLKKLDLIYNVCLPGLSFNFYNLNDFLYNMLSNVEFASFNYLMKEKNYHALESAKSLKSYNKTLESGKM